MEADQTLLLTIDRNAGWRVLGEALLAAVPLAGLSIILFRTGRRGPWPAVPWLLAAVLGPAFFTGLGGVIGLAVASPRALLTMMWIGWSQGAYASAVVMIIWLAIFGLRPRRPRQAPP